MFLIYINDIVKEINSCIRLFADDTTLYIIVDNPIASADLMNTDLDRIHSWSKFWLVKFNPDKTEELIISRKTASRNHPHLYMDDTQIKNVQSHKHLGITLNTTCTWFDHITDMTAKTWKRINVFRSLMYKLDRKTLEIIYFSFIRPTLEYADVIWDNCDVNERYRIEQIQIEAALIVTGATRSVSRTKLMNDTGWISLERRRYNHRIITFF